MKRANNDNNGIGYCRLAQAVISDLTKRIRVSQDRRWLVKTLYWVEDDNLFFDAFEECYGYEAKRIKQELVNKIRAKLKSQYDQ